MKKLNKSKIVIPFLAMLLLIGGIFVTSAASSTVTPSQKELIPATEADIQQHVSGNIAYTNPYTKISVFASKFSKEIYAVGGQEWTNYSFYLPVSSYVNVGMSGTVVADLSANAYTNYVLHTDNDQWGSYVDNYPTYSWFATGFMGLSEYESFYMTQGRHTIYLQGQSTPDATGHYTVSGSLSITTFPKN